MEIYRENMSVRGNSNVRVRFGFYSEQEGWLVRLSGRGRKDLMEIRPDMQDLRFGKKFRFHWKCVGS